MKTLKSITFFIFLLLGATNYTCAQWDDIFKKEVDLQDVSHKESNEGVLLFYYTGELYTGTIFHSWDRFNVKKGRISGKYREYDEKGNCLSEYNYVDGIKHGPFIHYKSFGKLERRGNYVNGNIDGLTILYYSNGNPWLKVNYKDGVENGLYESFEKNGKITKKGNYINGEKDGHWIENNLLLANEKTYSEAYYKNGEKIKYKTKVVNTKTGETKTDYYNWENERQINTSKNGIVYNSSDMQRFLKFFPCIISILDDDGVSIEISEAGNIKVMLSKTGITEYDAVGGLAFYENGIVQKINQPRATGDYKCIKDNLIDNNSVSQKNTLDISGDGNPNTGVAKIKIIWQTDAEGKDASTSTGGRTTPKNNCDTKPLPHEKGCHSVEIIKVQQCIGGIYVDGILNDGTIKKLTEKGYDMSQGLTKAIYADVMNKCGKTATDRLAQARKTPTSDVLYKSLIKAGILVTTDSSGRAIKYTTKGGALTTRQERELDASLSRRGYKRDKTNTLPSGAKYIWWKTQ